MAQHYVSVSPEKRTQDYMSTGTYKFVRMNDPAPYAGWPDILGQALTVLYEEKVKAEAAAWGEWSTGNSGSKYYSVEMGWHEVGWPLYTVGIDGGVALHDTEFRWLIPATPAGAQINYAAFTETITYSNGSAMTTRRSIGIAAGSYVTYHGEYVHGGVLDPTGWMEPDGYPVWPKEVNCYGSSLTATVSVSDLEIVYDYDETPDNDEEAKEIKDDEVELEAENTGEECWFEYDEVAHGFDTPHETEHQYTKGTVKFNVTGLTPDTWYWYRFVQIIDGLKVEGAIFYFKTKKTDDWTAYIITLPATEVWATGATLHGEVDYQGDSDPYLYLGFQWGLRADTLANEPIRWSYSGTFQTGRRPIQATINGLYPDRTYYFRACMHVGTPPMTANNYFGETYSFGGPQSVSGQGRDYVTAKRVSDTVSKLATGRYYVTRDGKLQYESAEHREI